MMENDRSPMVTSKQSKAQFFSFFLVKKRSSSGNIKKSKKNAKYVSQEQLKKNTEWQNTASISACDYIPRF